MFTFLAGRERIIMLDMSADASQDLADFLGNDRFGCVLADPPWQFQNRSGKMSPEHKRLSRYQTLTLDEIKVKGWGETEGGGTAEYPVPAPGRGAARSHRHPEAAKGPGVSRRTPVPALYRPHYRAR